MSLSSKVLDAGPVPADPLRVGRDYFCPLHAVSPSDPSRVGGFFLGVLRGEGGARKAGERILAV